MTGNDIEVEHFHAAELMDRHVQHLRMVAGATSAPQPQDAFDTFEALEALAMSGSPSRLEVLLNEFARLFPRGSLDLLNEGDHTFRLNIVAQLSHEIREMEPSDYLRRSRERDRWGAPLTVADILEALLGRGDPASIKCFIVKRLDSSVLFNLGDTYSTREVGVRGVQRPRGLSLSPLTARPGPHVLEEQWDLLQETEYLCYATRQAQRLIHRLYDPLRFTLQGTLDSPGWVGALRSIQRIVELTTLIGRERDEHVRRELTLSLLDLYERWDLRMPPSARTLKKTRGWLPESLLEMENDRIDRLLEDIQKEIIDGVFPAYRVGDHIVIDGRRQSHAAYASDYLTAIRNAATHGYHDKRGKDDLSGVLRAHSGRYPRSLPDLAIPLLEWFIGAPEHRLARFEEVA